MGIAKGTARKALAGIALAGIVLAGGAAPGVAADGRRPIEHPAERTLRELTRKALGEAATVRTWTEIARTLRELKEVDPTLVPAEAEAAALEALDAIASQTPGAVRELGVAPVGPHTEIVVSTRGEVRHRLFQRLSDPVNPRLTLVLTGASNAIVERKFDGIERGGVRAIEVTEFGADTVQIAVRLQAASPFMIYRRDDSIVLRIENPDGEFTPWSSRGIALAARRVDAGLERSEMVGVDPAESGVEGAGEAGLGVAGEEVPGVEVPGVEVAGVEVAGMDLGTFLALVGLAAAGGITVAVSFRIVRRRTMRRGKTTPARAELDARLSAQRQNASRIWVARTLAANGASADEIARKTGLARDAVLLLAPPLPGRGGPAEGAGAGSFCPDGIALAGAVADRSSPVRH